MAFTYEDEQKKRQEAVNQLHKFGMNQVASGNQMLSFSSPETVQTSRQKVLSQPVQEDKWYQGTMPTTSEMLARIYDIGKTDQQRASTLLDMYNHLSVDPSSPFYEPYRQSTNQKAIANLQALGVDVSGGITTEWLNKNKNLLAGARYTTTGMTPAAPAKGSTPENDAAYWYYTLMQDEERTQKAETEWKALQEEISYWAKRADLNLSDQEILGKIKWSDYKTLVDMDEAKSKGIPMQLNRGVGYSQDNLYGVIWAARNQSDKTDMTLNAMNYRLGIGNSYVENPDIRKYLNPDLDTYNPFKIKGTIDDASEYFGVVSFDEKWIHDHQYMRGSTDATEARMYDKVVKAEANTKAAEAELAELNSYIDEVLKYDGMNPETIIDGLLNDYKTLKKMNDSLQGSDLMETTRPIDFDLKEIEAKIRKHYAVKENNPTTQEYTSNTSGSLGVKVNNSENNAAIIEGKNAAIYDSAGIIFDYGTAEERYTWTSATASNFKESMAALTTSVMNGQVNPQDAYAIAMKSASNFAGANYMDSITMTRQYEGYQAEKAKITEELNRINSEIAGNENPSEIPETLLQQKEQLEQREEIVDKILSRDREKYDYAQEQIKSVNYGYEIAATIAKGAGIDIKDAEEARNMLDAASYFNQVYVPEISAYSVFDMASQSGVSSSALMPSVKTHAQELETKILELQNLQKWLLNNNINLGDSPVPETLQGTIDELQRELKDTAYFMIQDEPDFDKIVNNPNLPFIMKMGDESDPFTQISLMNEMTEWEQNVYKYLAYYNPESAEEFREYLMNNSTGKLNTRLYESDMQTFEKYLPTGSSLEALGTSLATILAQPLKLNGTLYSIESQILGEKANPHHYNYAFQNALDKARMGSKETFVKDMGGEDTLPGQIMDKGYDIVMSALDSGYNSVLTRVLGLNTLFSAGQKIGIGDKAITLTENMADALNSFMGASPMGAYAYGTTFQDVISRGGTMEQASLMAGITFLAETATEAVEFTNMTKAFNAKSLTSLLEDGGKLGLLHINDVVGEALSELIEIGADAAIMKDLSDPSVRVPQLMDQYGVTEDEAQKMWMREAFEQILWAGASGWLSTSVSESLSFMAGRAKNAVKNVVNRRSTTPVTPTTETQQTQQNVEQEETQESIPTVEEQPVEEQPVTEPVQSQEENQEELGQPISTEEAVPLSTEEMGNAPEATQATEATEATSEVTEATSEATSENVPVQTNEDAQKKFYTNQIWAISNAINSTNDISSRTSTLGAILAESTDPDAQALASTAAQHLISEYNDNDYGYKPLIRIQKLLKTAMDNGIDPVQLQSSITVAALSNGDSHSVLNYLMDKEGSSPFSLELTQEDINDLFKAVINDLNNPDTMEHINSQVKDNITAGHLKDLIASGALGGLSSYKIATRQAEENLRVAEENRDKAVEAQDAANGNMKMAESEFLQDAGNDQKKGAYQQALKDAEGKAIVADQMEQSVQKAEQQLEAAKEQEEQKTQETLKDLREQAQQMTEEELAAQAVQRQAKQVAQQQAAAIRGNEGTTYLDATTPIQYHYEVLDLGGLIASNDTSFNPNAAYPQELQPRDRSRMENRNQVDTMANTLNPNWLGESQTVQEGAPIVGSDYVVESGNGRVLAMRIAQENNLQTFKNYNDWLRQNAQKFGIDPASITDNSVLVRVRDTDVDRTDFVKRANVQTTASYSQTETAQSDADKLTDKILSFYVENDNGQIDNRANQDFIKAVIATIPENERNRIVQADGRLSREGIERIRNALFQKAYGNVRLTSALTESTDEQIKNILAALTNVAPKVAVTDSEIKKGNRFNRSISKEIAEAANLMQSLKQTGEKLEDRLNQFSMFGDVDPVVAEIAKMFDKYKRSAKNMTRALSEYLDRVNGYGNPNQISFTDTEAPEKLQLIQQSFGETETGIKNGTVPGQQSIFMSKGDTPTGIPTNDQSQSKGPIKSESKIIQELSNALGIKIDPRKSKYNRNLRKITKGYTHPETKVAHIKDESLLEVAAHELGHIFSKTFNLHSSADAIDNLYKELMKIPQEAAFLSQYDMADQNEEAIAEYTKLWLLDRDYAVKIAGENFVKGWETKLASRGWLKPMQQAAMDLRLNRSRDAVERAEAYIELEPTKKKKALDGNKLLRDAIFHLTDYTLPLQKITDATKKAGTYNIATDPRQKLLAIPSITNNMLETNIFDHMVDPEGNRVEKKHRGIGETETQYYGSFSDITKKIKDVDEKSFNTLWMLLHSAIGRDQQGKPVFGNDVYNTHATAEEIIREHPEFLKVIDEAEEWYEAFMMEWVVKPGNLDREVFKMWRKMYPYYVPTFVADGPDVGATRQKNTDELPDTGVRGAKGSTANRKNPVYGMVQYMQSYIDKQKRIEALRDFDTSMRSAIENNTLDTSIAEPLQKDMGVIDKTKFKDEAITKLQNKLKDMILHNPTISSTNNVEDIKKIGDELMTAIESIPDKTLYEKSTASGTDVLNIPMPDGTIHSWTIYDKQIFDAITNQPTPKRRNLLLRAASSLTRFLCANATSRDIGFSIQNMAGDTNTAINYGHSGGNYFTYIPTFIANSIDYLKQAYAEKKGEDTSDVYQKYKIFGTLGNRYAMNNQKTQREIREKMYEPTNKVKEFTKKLINAPVAIVEGITGFGEDFTRYNAFKNNYKGENASYADNLQAGKYAREDSVDFTRFGYDTELNPVLKVIVPFYGAQTQGISKTVETLFLSENKAERDKLLRRVALNSVIKGAMLAMLRKAFWDDDEKEAYDLLRDQEKIKYDHIKIGSGKDAKFIRLKKSQDMFIQLCDSIGELIGNTATGYEENAVGAIYNIAKTVLGNGLIEFNSVLNPFIDAANNTTWNGIPIDDYTAEQKPISDRYDQDTPQIFRTLSALAQTASIPISPNGAKYIAEQYTGSAGKIGFAFLHNLMNGENAVEGLKESVKDYVAGKFTIDPVYSNSLSQEFYNGKTRLSEIVNNAGSEGHSIAYFRADLTQDEIDAGLKEAKKLQTKGGAIYELNAQIKDLKKEHARILEDENILDSERDKQAREVRRQINALYLEANSVVGDYFAKYGYNNIVQENLTNALETMSIVEKGIPSKNYTLEDTFKQDTSRPYMMRSMEVFDKTKDKNVLPSLNDFKVTSKGEQYEVVPEAREIFTTKYKNAFDQYLAKNGALFDKMSTEEQVKIIKKARSKAWSEAADWYRSKYLNNKTVTQR